MTGGNHLCLVGGVPKLIKQRPRYCRIDRDFRFFNSHKWHVLLRVVISLKQCYQNPQQAKRAIRHIGCRKSPRVFGPRYILPEY